MPSKNRPTLLEAGGFYGPMKDGEPHLYNPKTIDLLQRACIENNYELYKEYASAIRNDYHVTLRSLLEFNFPVAAASLSKK